MRAVRRIGMSGDVSSTQRRGFIHRVLGLRSAWEVLGRQPVRGVRRVGGAMRLGSVLGGLGLSPRSRVFGVRVVPHLTRPGLRRLPGLASRVVGPRILTPEIGPRLTRWELGPRSVSCVTGLGLARRERGVGMLARESWPRLASRVRRPGKLTPEIGPGLTCQVVRPRIVSRISGPRFWCRELGPRSMHRAWRRRTVGRAWRFGSGSSRWILRLRPARHGVRRPTSICGRRLVERRRQGWVVRRERRVVRGQWRIVRRQLRAVRGHLRVVRGQWRLQGERRPWQWVLGAQRRVRGEDLVRMRSRPERRWCGRRARQGRRTIECCRVLPARRHGSVLIGVVLAWVVLACIAQLCIPRLKFALSGITSADCILPSITIASLTLARVTIAKLSTLNHIAGLAPAGFDSGRQVSPKIGLNWLVLLKAAAVGALLTRIAAVRTMLTCVGPRGRARVPSRVAVCLPRSTWVARVWSALPGVSGAGLVQSQTSMTDSPPLHVGHPDVKPDDVEHARIKLPCGCGSICGFVPGRVPRARVETNAMLVRDGTNAMLVRDGWFGGSAPPYLTPARFILLSLTRARSSLAADVVAMLARHHLAYSRVRRVGTSCFRIPRAGLPQVGVARSCVTLSGAAGSPRGHGTLGPRHALVAQGSAPPFGIAAARPVHPPAPAFRARPPPGTLGFRVPCAAGQLPCRAPHRSTPASRRLGAATRPQFCASDTGCSRHWECELCYT